jgi:hypothetical protein
MFTFVLLLTSIFFTPLPFVLRLPLSGCCVVVHRAVLFAVLDHYMRRNEGQKRVIGTLLGVVDEVMTCQPISLLRSL